MAKDTKGKTLAPSFEDALVQAPFSDWEQQDTGRFYIFRHPTDVLERFPVGTYQFSQQRDIGLPGFERAAVNPNLLLLGRDFAVTTPDKYFLLEDDTTKRGVNLNYKKDLNEGPDLIAHNVRVERGSTGSFAGYNVAGFKQDNAYLYQVAPNLFGTNSLFISGGFIDRRFNQNVDLLMYGTNSGKRIKVTMTVTNELRLEIVADPADANSAINRTFPAAHLRDTKDHKVGVIIDRHNGQIIFIVTNSTYELALCEFIPIPSVFGSFDAPNNAFVIGGNWDGTTCRGTFYGEASNFPIFASWSGEVDYMSVALVLAGIRDNPAKNVTVTNQVISDQKFNVQTTITGQVGSYIYAPLSLPKGLYDIFIQEILNTRSGNANVAIDLIRKSPMRQFSLLTHLAQTFLNGINLAKGHHFLGLEILTQDEASTGTDINFNYWKFNKISGAHSGGADNFVMLFDELTDRNNLVSITAAGRPYNNAFTNVVGTPIENGTYGRGSIDMAGGLFNLTIGYTTSPSSGKFDILINHRVVQTIDAYTTNTSFSGKKHFQVHIGGDNTPFEVRVNGKNDSSSGYAIALHYMKLSLLSNESQGGNVTIDALDNITAIVNSQNQLALIDNTVFNGSYYRMVGANTAAEIKKVYTGGVYLLRFDTLVNTDGGLMDIDIRHRSEDIQTISVFNALDFNNATSASKTHTKLLKVPSGHHQVRFKNRSGTNRFNLLEFRHLSNISQVGDDNLVVNESGLTLIGISEINDIKSTITLDLANISADQFDEIQILINGRSLNAGSIAMIINGITSGYKKVGVRNINGVRTSVSQNWTSQFELFTSELVNAADESYYCKMSLIFGIHEDDTRHLVQGDYFSGTQNRGYERGSVFLQADTSEITQITLSASGSQFSRQTVIKVFGLNKRS